MKFTEYLNKKLEEQPIRTFDLFIIQKMGESLSETEGEESEKIRHKAFREFRKRTSRIDFAAMTTMRRWFGIHGRQKPSRMIMFQIIFALGLERTEAEEYLTDGLQEPSFVISDYKEIIYLYGIENNKTYDQCEHLIDRFEENMDTAIDTAKTSNTRELNRQFENVKHFETQDFMMWMYDHADWFKGYSQTALNYLRLYRKQIIENVQKEDSRKLQELLTEVGYTHWLEKHKREERESKKSILKFVNNYKKSFSYNVSDDMRKMILELVNIVYAKRITNVQLMAEILATLEDETEEVEPNVELTQFKKLSGKYLSDLFRVPNQKELSMRIFKALREIKKMDSQSTCPEWIIDLLGVEGKLTVGEATDQLEKIAKQQKGRTLSIGREDLIPLIHTVAYHQYNQNHEFDYNRDEAIELFRGMVNATLTVCNMPPLNEMYEIDRIMMLCFSEEKMYSYADVYNYIMM